jgi:hypothetical protein
MWPLSYKTAIKKMRQYSKRKSLNAESDNTNMLPQSTPNTYVQCETGLQEWEERIPMLLSSPSRTRFQEWTYNTKTHLTKAQLHEYESQLLHARLQEQQKTRIRSRKSINSGGPITVEAAREKIQLKEKKEKEEAIRKAEKAVNDAVKKAQKELNRKGIDARKAERQRKKAVLELETRGEFIPLALCTPIRDPKKNPTAEELESLQPHPSLIQALNALRPPPIDPQLLDNGDSEVEFQLVHTIGARPVIPNDSDNSDNDDDVGIVSESDESEASIDSIARNADFISLF